MTTLVDLFILWYLAVMIAGALGRSSPRSRFLAPFVALIEGLGLQQHWAMFAPDPTSCSTRLYAVIRLSSGGAIRWDPPRLDESRVAAWLGFRRRLFEMMIATCSGEVARRSLASYLVDTYRRDGDPAVEVVFVRVDTPVDGDTINEELVERFAVEELPGGAEHAR